VTDIREYDPGDKATLVGLARELQAAEIVLYDRMKPPAEIGDWYIDFLLERCAADAGTILVAAEGSTLVGYAVVLTEVSSKEEPDELDYTYALIQDIAVSESCRGRGIGAALLARCESVARQAGARWLRLSVLAANATALRAYNRAGFKPLFSTMEKSL
jgi:ribosomal protein S18 acetylase RimI-like enzyme